MRDIHISIVSHNQFKLVKKLLSDFEKDEYNDRIYITITINVIEDISTNIDDYSYPIQIINNSQPKGFAKNHNTAFKQTSQSEKNNYFLVVNPDIRLHKGVIMHLINALENSKNLGLTAPMVYGINNNLEDSARELPTPYRIINKIFGNKGIWATEKNNQPDWVAGMFMAFKSNAFKSINGFDESYILYYEDVDICSRLWLKGYRIQTIHEASVVHDAQRTSRRNLKYLYWHISSMLRFFRSDTYQNIKMFHLKRIDA